MSEALIDCAATQGFCDETHDPVDGIGTGSLEWFLVHARPRQEAIAEEHLRRQGYEAYFPRVQLPRLRSSRWVDSIDALFPRYLFVGIRAGEQSLHPVRSTRGVSTVVRFGERYAPVPEALLDSLKAFQDVRGVHVLNKRPFNRGDRVHVIAGPFQGLEAIFEMQQGADRVRLLIEFIGTTTRAVLPAGHVLPTLPHTLARA
jgi:transcriptional antiterminator RfaH